MDQAMEEAIADMERLDAQLAESDARVRQLQNELVNEKEQSAHVWGASQALRERATNCEAELIAERQARQEAEEMLQKCQETARAAALQSQRQQRLSCAVMIVLVVAAAHLWWDSCMLLQ
jgi:chromosome segregation ATPase